MVRIPSYIASYRLESPQFHIAQRIIDASRYIREILEGKADIQYCDIQVNELEKTKDYILKKVDPSLYTYINDKFSIAENGWRRVKMLLEHGIIDDAIGILANVIEALAWILTKI